MRDAIKKLRRGTPVLFVLPFVFVDIFLLFFFFAEISELKVPKRFDVMSQKIFAKFANSSKRSKTKRFEISPSQSLFKIDLFSPLRKVEIFRHNKSNTCDAKKKIS
jgi:hypothetical protein